MALYTNLPVYKLGYDLLISIYEQTKLFSREHKYTLGERLKNDSLELLINIYKANKSKSDNRQNYIDVARQNAEVLRLLLRVSKDLQVISIKNFSSFNIKIEELSKQLASWHKYTAGARAKESNS